MNLTEVFEVHELISECSWLDFESKMKIIHYKSVILELIYLKDYDKERICRELSKIRVLSRKQYNELVDYTFTKIKERKNDKPTGQNQSISQ